MNQKYEISITGLQDFLVRQLEPTDWYQPLRFFIRHREFTRILEQLLEQHAMGRRFTPAISQVFRPFMICAKKDVGLVLSAAAPWPNPIHNDGLAFSSKSVTHWDHRSFCQLAGITTGDLSYLSPPTLLLNASLTRQINSPHLHTQIWAPFMAVLMELLPVQWVLVGPHPLSRFLDNKIEFPTPTSSDEKSEILFNLLARV